VILKSPSGQTYVTTPGSALLFPSLCLSTGGVPAPEADPPIEYCGDRTAMMPRRRRTRVQDRAHRIAAERRQNHLARTNRPHRLDELPRTSPAAHRRRSAAFLGVRRQLSFVNFIAFEQSRADVAGVVQAGQITPRANRVAGEFSYPACRVGVRGR
jgi:hypothetical protein